MNNYTYDDFYDWREEQDRLDDLERLTEEYIEQLEERIERLEMALDKACENLEYYQDRYYSEHSINPMNVGYDSYTRSKTKEQWKEWLLKRGTRR